MKKRSVDDVKNFWNYRSKLSKDLYGKVLWPDRPKWNEYIDKLQMHYLNPFFKKINLSDTVLDIGCGIGRFSFRLASTCKEVYGIDTSKDSIEFCIEKSRVEGIFNAKFEVMDVTNLKFDDETFDLVMSITCVQCITSKDDFISTIKELWRVTKKGGHILLLEGISDKKRSEVSITLSREEWFKIIETVGGKIEYWCGVDVPILRKILNLCFGVVTRYITRRNWHVNGDIFERDKKINELYSKQSKFKKNTENAIMQILTLLIKNFEYTIPKLMKEKSDYTLVYICKI